MHNRSSGFSILSAVLCTTILSASPVMASSTASAGGPTLHTQAAADASATSPYELHLMYTGEEWYNHGGYQNGSIYMQNAYASLHVDTDKAFGWTGGSFMLSGFYGSARSLDADLMRTYIDSSVIDTGGTQMVRLYEAYYDQKFGQNTDVLVGLHDLETEFGNSKPMGLFMGGAYAWTATLDQSGPDGNAPTFPVTPLALRVREKIDNNWSVLGAVADGLSDSNKYPKISTVNFKRNDGAFLIGEVDYRTTNRTKLMAGYWGYTGKFDDLNTIDASGDAQGQKFGQQGGYVGGTTRIYDQGNNRGLDVFANIGWGDSSSQQADRTLNMGLNYTGLLASRPVDQAGLAFSTSGASNAYKHSQTVQGLGVETYESNFEATYRAKINDWIVMQPDVQYFINPNMDPTKKNDLVVGVHFEIGHIFGL